MSVRWAFGDDDRLNGWGGRRDGYRKLRWSVETIDVREMGRTCQEHNEVVVADWKYGKCNERIM